MDAPQLTLDQRHAGAARSLALRQARAGLKVGISAGIISFNAALTFKEAQGMKIRSLLQALPGIGPKRAEALLDKAGVHPSRTVKQLGHVQRQALLDALAKR